MVIIQLQTAIERSGVTRESISQSTGIPVETISAMCENQVEDVSLSDLAAICEALSCPITDILARN